MIKKYMSKQEHTQCKGYELRGIVFLSQANDNSNTIHAITHVENGIHASTYNPGRLDSRSLYVMVIEPKWLRDK